MMSRLNLIGATVTISLLVLVAAPIAADLNDVMGVLPKFAKVGDRFQNMYFAAKQGNRGLAFYMSKYMNNAMNPAKLTKPDEYLLWNSLYNEKFSAVNKAIYAKDFAAFDKKYAAAITQCNECHKAMG